MDLQVRIARLESLEAIRQLKHRYLNACDLKEVETIRDCFAEGEVDIDYGPLGRFQHRDGFIELYQRLACQLRVIDSHHGANPEIELLDDDHARGRWALSYFNLDAQTGVTRRLGVIYDDRYQCIDGQWKITASRSRILAEVLGRHQP
ncbi:nuclear transport factor 2 family protein [Pseudomonas sp. H9]|uniref:nuclear transport factor 2 family protein n=1 Tax=Pseudomonas sp. H9 TaxID=483968 RepID=UPI0010578DC4|nr:nuclear transport factor 2 family protein [Pseudomonas sp. H9]TDF85970.1 nuclear transport factor 2 family protein [Pseudomonas sp. H9]